MSTSHVNFLETDTWIKGKTVQLKALHTYEMDTFVDLIGLNCCFLLRSLCTRTPSQVNSLRNCPSDHFYTQRNGQL